MAKGGKKRKKTGTAPSRSRSRFGLKPWEAAFIGAAVILAGWLGWQWQQDKGAEAAFLELAQSGEGALSRVVAGRSAGGGHISPGQSMSYPDRFPTTGAHDPRWIEPGVYDTVQPPTKLVHSNEHGMVVIYYDSPPADAMAMIREWAGLYVGPWSGVVVTPAPGLGEEVVLTAWNRTLRLNPFEPAAAAAFIDRFRGRGPENRVR
jgi:hypothetical protein